jgi:hypothetical protein
MLTYREAVPAMKAELDQAETASRLVEESRCAMFLSFNANSAWPLAPAHT